MTAYLVQVRTQRVHLFKPSLTGGESLTLPGGLLMTHGNNDVMELQPQLDLPACNCVLELKTKA